jgi:cytochrome c5
MVHLHSCISARITIRRGTLRQIDAASQGPVSPVANLRYAVGSMTHRRGAWLMVAALNLEGCGDPAKTGPTQPAECHATRVTECPSAAPVYADVEPLFQDVCSTCHSEPGGPWPLDDYAHVADWQDVIRDDLLTCAMPPPDSAVSLADTDRQLILTWIRCGYRE